MQHERIDKGVTLHPVCHAPALEHGGTGRTKRLSTRWKWLRRGKCKHHTFSSRACVSASGITAVSSIRSSRPSAHSLCSVSRGQMASMSDSVLNLHTCGVRQKHHCALMNSHHVNRLIFSLNMNERVALREDGNETVVAVHVQLDLVRVGVFQHGSDEGHVTMCRLQYMVGDVMM